MGTAYRPTHLGIDGGGTGLRIAVMDSALHLYGQAEGPGANPSLVGHSHAAALLHETVLAALDGLPHTAVSAVCIGPAGAAATHAEQWLLSTLAAILPGRTSRAPARTMRSRW